MNVWTEFVNSQLEHGATVTSDYGIPVVGRYGTLESEYRLLGEGPALVDRSYRGLLEITGSDRASWLHNLTTNQVKALGSGEGNHAFALNAQGRIVFDLNVLIRDESIWVDVDRRFLDPANTHFDRYIITEDVAVSDRSDEFVRLGLVGQRSTELLTELGAPRADNLPVLGLAEVSWGEAPMLLFRNDFCGLFGVEMVVPTARAVELWNWLMAAARPASATPVGDDAVQIRRIESGLPWALREITDRYLPAETGQLERAVSSNKGCYLGQEVVERMRSRGALARRLVGLSIKGDSIPPVETPLVDEVGGAVGTLTSSCYSPARGGVIGLGYVKTAHGAPGSAIRASWEGQSVDAVVMELPPTDAMK